MPSRRQFSAAAPSLLAWTMSDDLLAEPGKLPPPLVGHSKEMAVQPGRDVARVVSSSATSFKILHICDNHFFKEMKDRKEIRPWDERTIADWKKYVEQQKPDLVISNGDLWDDNPHPGLGRRAMEFVIPVLSALGVPWAFTWGNHDVTEDYTAAHDLLEKAGNSLYRGGATHGDYRIEVQGRGAREAEPPALDLFFMNTSKTGLTGWQLAWLARTIKELGRKTPALGFFHIPTIDYETLYQPGVTTGVKLEKVCNEKEAGESLPALVAAGVIRACFCGHDHVNDYMVSKDSVNLHYSRATGHGGYGGDKLRKGAKVIEVDLPTGKYLQHTVFPDGTRWDGKSAK